MGLPCGNCGAPMQGLRLAGHYGSQVEIDLCAPCHLVWFDAVESARLAGTGLLSLVEAMADSQALPHQPMRPDATCPRCRGGLKTVFNQTRWGRSTQLECVQQHGSSQTFAQFLTEKGLVRPMSSADRARLAAAGSVHCLNCGGELAAGDAACRWCTSVPSLFDVARLARALDPEGATETDPLHRRGAEKSALSCLACGAPAQAAAIACDACGATLATSRLKQAFEQVSALGPALQAHARRPAGHVVKRRLAAQSGDLDRRRQWAAGLQAEADAQAGRTPLQGEEDAFRVSPRVAVGLGVLFLLWWWLG